MMRQNYNLGVPQIHEWVWVKKEFARVSPTKQQKYTGEQHLQRHRKEMDWLPHHVRYFIMDDNIKYTENRGKSGRWDRKGKVFCEIMYGMLRTFNFILKAMGWFARNNTKRFQEDQSVRFTGEGSYRETKCTVILV